jgi:predicted dehydrogenase
MTEKVGIGIIGTGFARKVQIPAFLTCKNAEVISVASGTIENATKTASDFGIAHFTADWRETASHSNVDLVCITTPPNLHKEMVLFALEQGKHILAEKPMAMNVAEAEEMLGAAKKAGVMTLIDFELRFQPGRQRAYAMIREGEIGKLRHAKWNFRAPHRGDASLPWNWWSDIEQGGGALGAVNSHIIDSFNWFLGSEVSSVFCQLQSHVKQRPHDGGVRDVTTDDEANMLLRFAESDLTEDATGLVSVSMVEQPEYVNRLELFGTEGAIRIDHRGELFVVKDAEDEWRPIDVDLGSLIEGAADTGFSRAFRIFAPKIVNAIQNNETEIEYAATFEDGLKVQRVLDAARESNVGGTVVHLQ